MSLHRFQHVIDADTFKNGLHDRFDNDHWVNYCANEILRQGYDGLKGRSTVVYCLKNDDTWEQGSNFWFLLA